MAKVYRYAESKWNDALVTSGSIRVGTLHDYRGVEHKAGISDPYEGMKSVSHHIESYMAGRDSSMGLDARAVETYGMFNLAPGASLNDVIMIWPFDEPNCFIHCSSSDYSLGALNSLEGADSCVVIEDILEFYRAVTRALNDFYPVELVRVSKVFYQNRHEAWNGVDWGKHPALVKDKSFYPQREVRALWQCADQRPIKPQPLIVPELIKLCRKQPLPPR